MSQDESKSREALRAALADAEVARRYVEDARAAGAKAKEHLFAAEDRLARLRDQNANAKLGRPEAEMRAKLESAEREIAMWRRARDTSSAAIPARERELGAARRRVDEAARGVICATVDVERLLREAEAAAAAIVAKRGALIQLLAVLPDGPEREAVEIFLGRAWLMHEFTGELLRHSVTNPYRDAHAALLHDADAPVFPTTPTPAIPPLMA